MDKTRIVGMVLLGLMVILAGVVGFESGQDDGPDNMPYFWVGSGRSGIVQTIAPTELVLKSGNENFTFEINKMTKFASRGSYTPVIPGVQVQVRYGTVGTRLVARQIRVLQTEASDSPPPAASDSPAPELSDSPAPADTPTAAATP